MTAPTRRRPRPTEPAPTGKAMSPAVTILLITLGVVAVLMTVLNLVRPGEPASTNVATAPVAAPAVPAADPADAALARAREDLDRRIAENDAEVNSAPRAYVTDGTWEVGNQPGQMRPGTYRATGSDCYWARSSDTTGDADSILANGFATGPTVVTVKASDAAFSASGGCMWSRKG